MELGTFSVSLTVKDIVKSQKFYDTPTSGDSGPGHCVLKDPDGNVIMFDQHF